VKESDIYSLKDVLSFEMLYHFVLTLTIYPFYLRINRYCYKQLSNSIKRDITQIHVVTYVLLLWCFLQCQEMSCVCEEKVWYGIEYNSRILITFQLNESF